MTNKEKAVRSAMSMKKKYIPVLSLAVLLAVIIIYTFSTLSEDDSKKETETVPTITAAAVPEKTDLVQNTGMDLKSKVEDSTVYAAKDTNGINEEVTAKIGTLIDQYYDLSAESGQTIFTTQTKEEQEQRTALLKKKREIIEEYRAIKNYIKPGLTENTYLVFTSYNIKLVNIKTSVPGMSVLTVVRNEAGEYLIDNSPNDEKLKEYIKDQTQTDDMKGVIEDVNTRLAKALAKDTSLKKMVNYINEMK